MNQLLEKQEHTQFGHDYKRDTRSRRPESFEVMLRKFNREIQQIGLLTEVKKRRFWSKDMSRTLRRQIAKVKYARRREKRGY
ncbi:30S ribosomal protein S21 [Candidatus Berkelbacteria bacterium]|nr:30S ribosomal protein S21 [Candidatus Berkelbacteria bacterium]